MHSRGATFTTPEIQPVAPAQKPSSAQSSPPTSTSKSSVALSSSASRRASPEHSLTATTPSISASRAMSDGGMSVPLAFGLL